jgi:ABC-type antimicrobial peptide transport system permease subunit
VLVALMAAAGMYSVIWFLVSPRTGELAIRMALGASKVGAIKAVLRTTMIWVTIGLAAGLGLGLPTAQTLRWLTNTQATASPATYGATILLFLAVTLMAAYLPARRAARLDPAEALRCE